jgi:hypothetical protein
VGVLDGREGTPIESLGPTDVERGAERRDDLAGLTLKHGAQLGADL